MLRKRVPFRVVLALLFLFPGIFAGAQAYNKIVVIGDSLTDTGNDLQASLASGTAPPIPYPLTGYTSGRFTSGTDTTPAAHNYFGVWVEQFAAMLPGKPTILNSLAGGTNYAYGFATTDTGQSTFAFGGPNNNMYQFQVNNMGQQVSDYLATKPTIDNKTLFVVWGGANDLIAAAMASDPATAAQLIGAAAQREAGIVQALITAGATDFIVPNLPPLGLVPRFNGSAASSTAATQAAAGFDQALAQYLAAISAANTGKTLHIYSLDTYTLFSTIVAAPANQGFVNVTMPSSAAFAAANAALNPDTYLFWDDLHPTTHGHNLIALAAMSLIGTPVSTTTTLKSSNANANQNASVTFTATVTSASGIPSGTVAFTDGSTVLNSVVVTGTTTTSTVTYTTSALSAGTHNIQATFTGVNGYTSSSSAAVSEIVTAPAFSTSLAAASLNIKSGGSGTVMLTLTPVGGFTGTATLACGPLPAHFTCSVSPASIPLSGNNTAVTATVTIGTAGMAALEMPGRAGDKERIIFAFAFPCFGLLGWGAARRRGKRSLRSLTLSGALLLLCGAGALGITGCGNSNNAKTGSYPVTVVTTANGISSTSAIQVNVQ